MTARVAPVPLVSRPMARTNATAIRGFIKSPFFGAQEPAAAEAWVIARRFTRSSASPVASGRPSRSRLATVSSSPVRSWEFLSIAPLYERSPVFLTGDAARGLRAAFRGARPATLRIPQLPHGRRHARGGPAGGHFRARAAGAQALRQAQGHREDVAVRDCAEPPPRQRAPAEGGDA